ncbi:hypothetical protein D3C71_1853930 [compost metagenome]
MRCPDAPGPLDAIQALETAEAALRDLIGRVIGKRNPGHGSGFATDQQFLHLGRGILHAHFMRARRSLAAIAASDWG